MIRMLAIVAACLLIWPATSISLSERASPSQQSALLSAIKQASTDWVALNKTLNTIPDYGPLGSGAGALENEQTRISNDYKSVASLAESGGVFTVSEAKLVLAAVNKDAQVACDGSANLIRHVPAFAAADLTSLEQSYIQQIQTNLEAACTALFENAPSTQLEQISKACHRGLACVQKANEAYS